MLTAMQIMLDDLLSKREVYLNAKMYESVATLETSINIAEALIEKEKEQIIDACNSILEDSSTWGERYYNQKYQNK
jgi:hypothetical protein